MEGGGGIFKYAGKILCDVQSSHKRILVFKCAQLLEVPILGGFPFSMAVPEAPLQTGTGELGDLWIAVWGIAMLWGYHQKQNVS